MASLEIPNPISSIADVAKSILDKVLPDKVANDAAKARLGEMALSGELQQIAGQLAINQVEAASTNWFVAGWRPCIGWICAFGLAYEVIVQPLGTWVAALCQHPIVAPKLDTQLLLALLLPMLGIGAARTIEKIQGVDTKG
jgi:hypothetical protein